MYSPLYDEERERELLGLIEDISQVIKEDKNNPKHYYARSLEYYQLSQQYFDIFESFEFIGNKELYFKYVNKAYDDIEKAMSFNLPLDDYAYTFKLFLLKKLKKWENLIEYGKTLYDGIGLTSKDIILIGEAYFNLKEWQDCIDFYTMAIEELGEEEINSYGKVFVERGIAQFELNQYEQAINDYKKHIEFNEVTELDKYNVYDLMAKAYEEIEEFGEAVKAYTEELKIYSDEPDIYFQRGRIYCDYLYEYSLASEDFDNAIKYSYKEFYIYFHYCGYAYVHKGEIQLGKDKQLALKCFDRAIEAYKIANKLQYKNINSREAKISYDATVGYAILLRDELLNIIKSPDND